MAVVQAAAGSPRDALARFAAELEVIAARFPEARLVVYPEQHLCAAPDEASLRAFAEPIEGPRTQALAALAAAHGLWLVPGSVPELGPEGQLFNTAQVFSPAGELVAYYRKIFPWRPYEPFDPGSRFVVFELEDVGRVGLAICYDAWFPEVGRQLAWLGSELVVIPVRTTTADREQELVMTRAMAIANQIWVVSANAAAPLGVGRSAIFDPEGHPRVVAADSAETVLTDTIDFDAVTIARRHGTAALNRPWSQFHPGEPALTLPAYDGRIDPANWHPRAGIAEAQ